MTKTIKITGDIEITESQAREVVDRLKEFDEVEVGYWEPEEGDQYYFIDGGDVLWTVYSTKCNKDIKRAYEGNCYKTQALAQKELDRRIAKQKIRKYIWENGMEWTPDWSKHNEDRYTFLYNREEKKFMACGEGYIQYSPEKEYFKTEEHLDKFLTDCLPELKIVWGV